MLFRPPDPPPPPARWRGRLDVAPDACQPDCYACVRRCPSAAIRLEPLALDLGACVSCGACTEVCPTAAITATTDPRVATRTRRGLVRRGAPLPAAEPLAAELQRRLGRALRLRVVDTGDCGACGAEIEAAVTAPVGLEAWGIELVLSPRHADGVLVTGPITPGMRDALRRTLRAVAPPRLVIAVGACAISGGPFREVTPLRGLDGEEEIPVDLFVPGCPPHPVSLLDGLLRLLGEGGVRMEPRPYSGVRLG